MSGNFELLTRLVNEQESKYLDFKLKYHDNNANLIYDILCLANSLHNDEKYIIFGINDKRKIIGINKKSCPKQHDIIALLRSVKLNKSLYNYITFEAVQYNLKTIGLLTIIIAKMYLVSY